MCHGVPRVDKAHSCVLMSVWQYHYITIEDNVQYVFEKTNKFFVNGKGCKRAFIVLYNNYTF